MKIIYSIIACCFLFSCTKQQTERTFGADKINETELSKVQVLVSSITQYRRVKPPRNPPPTDTVVVPPPVVIPPVVLPASITLQMPPVVNQGSEGACVAFALAYARGYEVYKRTGATSYSQSVNILSPEYIFNQIKTTENCLSSALITGLNFIRDNGTCTWASMPYTWMGCSLQPTPAQTAEAANFRIISYSSILASDVSAIKTMLANKRPLVCQVVPDNEFTNATTGFHWKIFTSPVGVHAVTIVGYDDSKSAFLMQNSWGTSWGTAGYCWIDYNLMKTVSSNLFVMNL
jgi:C1A family cysteine protease